MNPLHHTPAVPLTLAADPLQPARLVIEGAPDVPASAGTPLWAVLPAALVLAGVAIIALVLLRRRRARSTDHAEAAARRLARRLRLSKSDLRTLDALAEHKPPGADAPPAIALMLSRHAFDAAAAAHPPSEPLRLLREKLHPREPAAP